VKNKKSFKALWNVFLFVIFAGLLIYGFVQQRRVAESRVQTANYQQQIDSLKIQLEKIKEQLQIEKNLTESALKEAKRQEQKTRN